MSKRTDSVGLVGPDLMTEDRPTIPWRRFAESFPDDDENDASKYNNEMKNSQESEPVLYRVHREVEEQTPEEEEQQTIISLKLPQRVILNH